MKNGSTILLIAATCMMLGIFTHFNMDKRNETIANANPSLVKETEKQNQKENKTAKESQKLSEFKVLDNKLRKAVEIIKKEHMEAGIIPAKLMIPKINVKANIERVGVLENGQMGVPSNIENTGWFEPGTKPGAQGNAVIDGHVDSKTGPAVFFDLKDLKPGDEILLSDQKGKTITFIVKKLKSYPNDKAPLKEIFGPASTRNLNLITCTGVFNHTKGTHEERLVVYTELKEKTAHSPKKQQNAKRPISPDHVSVEGTFVSWHAVRDKDIVGYRVYKGKKNKPFKHVASISAYERKTYTDQEAEKYSYYVTSITKQGMESKPSSIIHPEKQP
ncbi:class F sortase [Fictibacillus fluitans]|uniref:Class F sortase n=1 Tax=Fictibacillus fluitans TaxID=3058422 RepID=A0ABT8HUV7_9BACL|nr:class F sortase [Fictibacillus sp. NE201]MDN4524528.1 class F sortase [Fictibacillus sp. NE201]